eukprot:3088447-Pleurochrysis_carterae.AAC.1
MATTVDKWLATVSTTFKPICIKSLLHCRDWLQLGRFAKNVGPVRSDAEIKMRRHVKSTSCGRSIGQPESATAAKQAKS